jgi:hypothetical protein
MVLAWSLSKALAASWFGHGHGHDHGGLCLERVGLRAADFDAEGSIGLGVGEDAQAPAFVFGDHQIDQ